MFEVMDLAAAAWPYKGKGGLRGGGKEICRAGRPSGKGKAKSDSDSHL